MRPLVLSEIWIYPVKSLGGIALHEASPRRSGFQYDRRWMLVDENGRFVSQREIPQMALLGTAIEPPFLTVFWKHNPAEKCQISLSINPAKHPNINVEVWDDRFEAVVLPADLNRWFSEQLQRELRLVYMTEQTARLADDRYAPEGHTVSFADGFPYLIIGQATLDALNGRLPNPVPMDRFRPNMVFTGGEAFEEDAWSDFNIGQTAFRGVKPCARCIITTTDQRTGARNAEPLKTLATFRKVGNKIFFGQNAVWMGNKDSILRVGDLITPQTCAGS